MLVKKKRPLPGAVTVPAPRGPGRRQASLQSLHHTVCARHSVLLPPTTPPALWNVVVKWHHSAPLLSYITVLHGTTTRKRPPSSQLELELLTPTHTEGLRKKRAEEVSKGLRQKWLSKCETISVNRHIDFLAMTRRIYYAEKTEARKKWFSQIPECPLGQQASHLSCLLQRKWGLSLRIRECFLVFMEQTILAYSTLFVMHTTHFTSYIALIL